MNSVVYIIISANGMDRFIYTILPELEAGSHKLTVSGICFFDSNAKIFQPNEPMGHRLNHVAKQKGITLMIADTIDLSPKADPEAPAQNRLLPSQCPVIVIEDGQQVALLPDLYAALNGKRPDYMLSL